MEGGEYKINSFTDLRVWKEAHSFILCIYRETKSFPKEEQFGLTSQLRRASVSITSNIADGFGRLSYQEKLRFYYISLGSLTEVQNQLTIARDVGYVPAPTFQLLSAQGILIHKMLNAFITSTRRYCK